MHEIKKVVSVVKFPQLCIHIYKAQPDDKMSELPMNATITIIIIIMILKTIKARKPISHIIMYTKFVYKDDTVILFLRCWKAHDTNLLKMYFRWLSVVSEINLHLPTLVKLLKAGLRSKQ